MFLCSVILEISSGTPGSIEHSLDSDSDEESGRGELQPLSPTDPSNDTTIKEPSSPPVLLVNLQCPSGSDHNPPALPESEPPELDEPEVPTSSMAVLNINQSNNTTKTL